MADELYNMKLESLQQYIPFLDNMIAQLKDPNKKNREQQLNKMQSLHAMITDKRKKLKLETLVKCEDVISKLYEKVHNKPIGSKKIPDNFMTTPASPSPPREILIPTPLTIPTERVEENRIPKIDIYSSAGESLNRHRLQQNLGIGGKVPDMSKPPISLEDLKTLEEDVQEKINEVSLNQASLHELNNLREKLTEQIHMEEVLLSSPQKQKKEELEAINTTVRNNLNLTKKLIQPPEKLKIKDVKSPSPPNKPLESNTSSPKKEVKQPVPTVSKSPKILKEPASIFGSILSNIDDQILEGKKKKEERRSSLTGKDEKKSDKDPKKKDRKHSISKDGPNEEKKDNKDAKKKERSSSSVEEKSTTKEEKKSKGTKESDAKKKDQSGEKSKSKIENKDGDKKEDKHSSKSKNPVSLSGKTSFEVEEERLKKELESKMTSISKENNVVKESEDEKDKSVVGKITVKKDLAVIKAVTTENKEEEPTKQATFKRLADKYNPKPKKPVVEQDVDKAVSDIIEENMKTSPPKQPVINQMAAPIPPPASLILCSQMEPEKPEPPPAPLPTVLQNILNPSTTELINTVVSQLRHNNAEAENRNVIPPTRTAPPVDNFVSDYARDDNFVSDYTREEFSRNEFTPNNIRTSDFNNFQTPQPQAQQPQPQQPQPQPQQPQPQQPLLQQPLLQQPLLPLPPQHARRERLNFEPPTPIMNNQFNQMGHQNQRYAMGEVFNDNFSPRPFTPMPQGFPQNFNNFQPNQNTPVDIQPLDYYPPNAPIPPNQFNSGPPLLSPEVPHYHNEQKPANFGMMPNHDPYVHEDMRWRQEDNRFSWDRNHDHRLNRDPRTYREYREMRESRDPRIMNRDPRDNRDQRDTARPVRDPRVNRDLRDNRETRDREPRDREPRDREPRDREPRDREPRDRDPRLNKERESRDFDRDRPRFRDSRTQNTDVRPNRYDTKFDRMYSRTNREDPRSRSRSSSYSKDTFTSPLDSLYSGKEEHKTGKGYGVQHFRIPKIKKEDEEKEQSTKVSSTNEDVSDAVHSINDDSNDSANNEVTGNDVDTEISENAEQTKEEVTKKDTAKDVTKESEQENKTTEKEAEVEKINEEPPKLQNETEETNTDCPKPVTAAQPAEQDQAKPADQTILAQFFANLLGSQNKKEKKTALYSLISTFSDSFSEKELSKITKIIRADEATDSSEEEEEAKKPEPVPEIEASKEPEPEKEVEAEEVQPEDSPVKTPKRKNRKRIRRISSTASLKDEKEKEEETAKPPEPPETLNVEEESVVVSVGERIKSRKRASSTPSKPKKKCKTELDLLHEDIQDMFIRDGVLTASGKRMCRILKNDPNALTTPQTPPSTEPPKMRKKPGPKPKPKPNTAEMKTVKNIRVLIQKIPDSSLEQKEENPRRSLRSATKPVYAESDDDDTPVPTEEDSIVDEGSLRGDDSDADSTDTEKDKTSQSSDNVAKTKVIKRKRGKGWASGNIPSNKKKKKKSLSAEEQMEKVDNKSPSAFQSDSDKSFVVPDKNYYIDFVTNKSHECRLCDYQGIRITTHYKLKHPESEILTSRFSPAVALEAVEDSKKNLVKYENLMTFGTGKFHYTCRLCAFNTTVPPTIFYDHITTHTGEYRHVCPICDDFSASSGKTLKSHMLNSHNNVDKRVARKSYKETIVFGYMCGECNYVQVTQKNVEDHINIFHLEKPDIYKVNMSTTLDPDIVKAFEKESNKDELPPVVEEESEEPPAKGKKSKANKAEKPMLPPQSRKHPKAAPKSVKDRLKAKQALAEKDADFSDASSIAESESSFTTESEKTTTPERPKPKPAAKRRLTREVSTTSEEEVVVGGRSRRAAKDKATEKLKTLMEFSENTGRKKSLSGTAEEDKTKPKEVVEPKTNTEQAEAKPDPKPEKEEDKPLPEKKEVKPLPEKEGVKALPEKTEEQPKIKKEIELNVFTCKTDIQEENKKIEQERLQLMDELNKSVGSRTSLNFVDKLCDRLSNNDIMVKQEPRDDLTDSLFPSANTEVPLTMPVLEKSLPTPCSDPVSAKVVVPTPHPKKPVLETENMQVSNPSFDVTLKNNKSIMDMIQKLKGKMANISDDKSESSILAEDVDYDSEGPPPLTHVNKLPNVKPADGSSKTMLIGGLMKVIKHPSHLVFSCLVPPCLFSTENKDAFQKHCSEAHKLPQDERLTLCDMCGMEMVSTEGSPFLADIFRHALEEHGDFMNADMKLEENTDSVKPPNRQLRLRKLSGDALSIVKKDWEEEIDKTATLEKPEETTKDDAAPASEVVVNNTLTADEPAASVAELELSDDNPFPFKIAGVMSLAEPLPPLAPLVKPPVQVQSTSQLVVKEAKLTQTEVSRPRKTPKAMAKFIASVSDLYKCPHYYCLFSTNFRDFLERHLKAHKVEHDMMIPCVYCDMKTPWEHVPMHIDIRHAHCRFACSYCMYRAVLKEYVFLHQDQTHPENDYSVIALPQPKHSKKWAIADVKVDPKTLCEPYRCTPLCGVEFLFENEFKRHLQEVHKTNFIGCGYKGCGHRVQSNKMLAHWILNHGVGMYQCGHCKMNSNDIRQMYKHFALFHQGMVPDILVRKLAQLQEGVFLGYSPEAFSALRKIITIPGNISGENKRESFEVEPATVPVILPGNTSVPYGLPTNATLQVVTSLSQGLKQGVILPGSKAVLNRAITLVTSNSGTTSGNILLLPSVSSGATLTVSSGTTMSGIVVPSQQNSQITSVAAIGKTLKLVPSGLGATTPVPEVQETVEIPVEKDCTETVPEKDATNLTIEPLEHITLSEDNSQGNEEADACEADPLSLEAEGDADADMNDASKSADSSGDESDKPDKPKNETKSGLMSYQLYRCAFCDISFSNSVDFKRHATFSLNCRIESQVVKPFVCVHCGKQLRTPHVLVEHVQCHGVLRFTCSLCGNKFANVSQTRNHIKNRHNITHTSLTPLNPAKQNVDADEFLVRPKLMLQLGTAKDPAPAEPSTSTSASENVYTPETIDQIPMRHILSSTVKCGICSYTTKVRTNMVRHLQFHSEEKAVSDTAPVNPVPCLEKNEKMFDKMINLASSSHSGSRMGGAKPDGKEKETENLPDFVPSHCRYVCCAHGCSYICPEEGNLRHHLIALHDSETSFTCVHCKADLTPTDADSLLKHFKLHGLQLHKCGCCSFVHHLKHKVEKHMADNHADVPAKIVTVRAMESEPKDGTQEPSTSSAPSVAPPAPTTKYYKPWRCCMCKYKSGTQDGIEAHVLEKHEFDAQFKCALCTYKTNDKETFPDHFKTGHDNQSVDIIYAYRKLEDDKEKESETFDTTPLWQRDRPRVRHIRGILFDESSPAPVKSPKKTKVATPTPGPSGVKTPTPSPGPSGAASTNLDLSIESVANGTADILKDPLSTTPAINDDFFHTVNKMMRESNEDIAKVRDSLVIVIEDEDEPKVPAAKNKDNKNAPVAKNRVAKRKGAEVSPPVASKISKISEDIIDLEGSSSSSSDSELDEFSERSLKVRFGAFGMPLWRQFKCPVCNLFKSKRISDFVFHLFKEMKVFRFKCNKCSDESITYRYMHKHASDHHSEGKREEIIGALPPNEKLLTWLQMVIREQSIVILRNYPKSPQPATAVGQELVQCEFCSSRFRTEQEKNEHGVCHWTAKPYNCTSCQYSSYVEQDVLKHFQSAHEKDAFRKESEMVVSNGPTVQALLKISDDQHEKEAQTRMASKVTETPQVVEPAPAAEPPKDPLEVTPEPENKEDETPLSDSDLIILTKTDSADVPAEGDIFCCEYCAFMANSETQVISHISGQHEHMLINFRKLNRTTCENPKEHVGCSLCAEVGSEVTIRRHHDEKHSGLPLFMFRYQCGVCPKPKRFLKFMGLKVHFNRLHRDLPMQYTSVSGGSESKSTGEKTYKCPICPYVRNLKPSAVNNIRQHVKQHFKAFSCGICRSIKYKTRSDVLTHYAREHSDLADPIVNQDMEIVEKYSSTMNEIIRDATEVFQQAVVKNCAKKSTSTLCAADTAQEYSFYGSRPEEVDMSRIMTSVEVNGMHLNMSAEKLSKIFDLNVSVALEDCNLSVNLSSVFDS